MSHARHIYYPVSITIRALPSAPPLMHLSNNSRTPISRSRSSTGADNHIAPDFVAGLRSGRLLALADTRYVLVEPPHHVLPAHLEDLFFAILVGGFVPILTHPERLSWVESKYEIILRLVERGVWMQITSGSLLGRFGKRARYWAERMLSEGQVHIMATDAHDNARRPPDLLKGRMAAEKLVGREEAERIVVDRPTHILSNKLPKESIPLYTPNLGEKRWGSATYVQNNYGPCGRGIAGRLRKFFSESGRRQ